MKLFKKLIILSTFLLVSSHGFAADVTVEMLNKLDNETSVPKDSQEESPDLKQKESEEVPETIFQG